MKDLRQITVVGLGLLGGSITLRILRSLPGVKTVGYTHRPSARAKARIKNKLRTCLRRQGKNAVH